MSAITPYTTHPSPVDTGNVISINSLRRERSATNREQTVPTRARERIEVHLTREELPLTVQFDDKTYVLVLTKSNKLLLQKPIN
jgi:hemin uptake protein HemP